MLYKMSITAMITEDEYNTLLAEDKDWMLQGNTFINRKWKKEGIDSVAISIINKGSGYIYRHITITFVGFNTENITRKYIDNRIQKTCFQNSYRKDYKSSGFVFRFFVKTNILYEWRQLFVRSYNLESRSMKRELSSSGKTISYTNEDMELNIRFAGDISSNDNKDQEVFTKLSDISDWDIQIRIMLRKGKIHSCIRKYEYEDRSLESIMKVWKDLEKRITEDYLTAILGGGNTYSAEKVMGIIEESTYTRKKKDRLKEIFDAIQTYNDIDAFLQSAAKGDVVNISNRKSAMDYLRCLESLNINPVAHALGEDVIIPNIITVLG